MWLPLAESDHIFSCSFIVAVETARSRPAKAEAARLRPLGLTASVIDSDEVRGMIGEGNVERVGAQGACGVEQTWIYPKEVLYLPKQVGKQLFYSHPDTAQVRSAA